MSKEQIKIICDDARVITDNDNKMIRCHINIKYFDWLIEQVQELEKELIYYKMATESYEEMESQNKRYREAIGVAVHNMKSSDNLGVKFALGILEQALEEGDDD